jgi:hypothetical protein
MKQITLTLIILIGCLSSCKKKDDIPNPLYGEWRLTEWIFEGRDITDSIDVIWGEDNRFINEREFAAVRSLTAFYTTINGNRTRAAIYEYMTDDYKFMGLYMKNRDTLFISDSLATKYLISVGVNYKTFEIINLSQNYFTLYSLYGVNKLNFEKL